MGYNIKTAYVYEIRFLNSLFVSPLAGVGIVHLFRPKDSYLLENGVYKLYNDRGIIRPEAHLGLKLGYNLNKIEVFGSYQAGFQYGYYEDIQLLPFTYLVIGLSYE